MTICEKQLVEVREENSDWRKYVKEVSTDTTSSRLQKLASQSAPMDTLVEEETVCLPMSGEEESDVTAGVTDISRRGGGDVRPKDTIFAMGGGKAIPRVPAPGGGGGDSPKKRDPPSHGGSGGGGGGFGGGFGGGGGGGGFGGGFGGGSGGGGGGGGSGGLGLDLRNNRRRNDNPFGRSRESSDSERSRAPKIAQILASSSKVIKSKLTRTSDIVLFTDSLERLENSILDTYPEETEKVKILIALNQMDEQIRSEGDSVFELCKESGFYCLNSFLREVFTYSFPSPQSSLNTAFESLSQNFPTKSSITDYARRFRSIIHKLKYNIEGFKGKFVDGLANNEIKQAIRRSNWEGLEFQNMVSLATSIEANLQKEKISARAYFAGYETRGDAEGEQGWGSSGSGGMGPRGEDWGEDEGAMLIMGIPIKRYFNETTKHNMVGRCFNCFSKAHRVGLCPKKSCKFCEKSVSMVKHYSILCPKAPKSFTKFLDVREEAKRQADKARYAEDYADYEFGDSDLDSE